MSEAKLSGFDNYLKAFSDKSFINSFLFTAVFTLVSMIIINVAAFFLCSMIGRLCRR